MLPPVVGKIIHFTNFNKIPLFLIIMSLSIRVAGDFILVQPLYSLGYIWSSSPRILTYFFGLSGWFIVAAMLAFVIMIHKSKQSWFKSPNDHFMNLLFNRICS
jgi:hypothetical protein